MNKLNLPPVRADSRNHNQSTIQTKKSKDVQQIRIKTEHIKSQRQLMFELKNLEDALGKKMVFINNYLFTTQVTPKLIQSITQQLTRNRSSMANDCFHKILQLENDQEEEEGNIYKRIRNLGKQNQISYYQSQNNLEFSLQQDKQVSKLTRKLSQKPRGYTFNTNDLQKMLKKQEKAISVFVPPTSYPQFFGYIVYGKLKPIEIEKIFIPTYLNPIKMFGALMVYLSKILETQISFLQIKTTKEIYYQRFKKWGWSLKGFVDSKYRVWYKRSESVF